MTKLLVALIILVSAGGLFLYTQQAIVPSAEEQTAQQEVEQNPFGEGSNVVGSFDDDDVMEGEVEDAHDAMEDDDAMENTSSGTQQPSADSGTQTGTVSRAELATHNTQSNCWVAYKGVVYDVTDWLPRHPGSAGAIAPYCGTAEEFAAAFNKQHGTKQEGRLEKEGVNEGQLGD